jgi:NAD-specific glutamate dehydrogenase
VARVHFSLAALLDLAWLESAIDRAPRRSGWDRLALTSSPTSSPASCAA